MFWEKNTAILARETLAFHVRFKSLITLPTELKKQAGISWYVESRGGW